MIRRSGPSTVITNNAVGFEKLSGKNHNLPRSEEKIQQSSCSTHLLYGFFHFFLYPHPLFSLFAFSYV